MTLHDHEKAGQYVYLSGVDAGRIKGDSEFRHFDDYEGSVTLHNTD